MRSLIHTAWSTQSILATFVVCAALSGCGGGGGDASTATGSVPSSSQTPALASVPTPPSIAVTAPAQAPTAPSEPTTLVTTPTAVAAVPVVDNTDTTAVAVETAALVRCGTPPTASNCTPKTAVAAPVKQGLIIPAYLPLNDSAGWTSVMQGAAVLAASKSSTFKDYWVVVNSDTSGPFSSTANWAKAAAVWNPVRSNGGRIFGYVHTCVQPTGPTFRSLRVVKAEITAWVKGYPALDGIWLDEFYPRFELADTDGVSGPNFPNGLANAPTDRGNLDASKQFTNQQSNPAGGYYDQLTQWVRATYPHLRIIGNAGGHFYSNQKRYGELVDVLVSFEQNINTASNAPANDFAGLTRQVTTGAQLALIHRNTTNMALALDQAYAKGYTHVYTTSRLIEEDLWGGLPPYFISEVERVASRP